MRTDSVKEDVGIDCSTKLYIFLGPPKTATTSLQYFLQSASGPFIYMGTSQPRSSKGLEGSAILHKAVVDNTPDDIRVQETILQIRELLKRGNNVIIAEEIFLVDEVNGLVLHQDKIERLAEITRSIPVVAIICLRDPIDGLKSLYQELYHRLPLKHQMSFRSFLKSNHAKVFDYKHLSDLIESHFNEIIFMTFDTLVASEFCLRDILGPNFSCNESHKLRKENVSSTSKKRRELERVAVGKIFRPSIIIPKWLRDNLKSVKLIRFSWDILKGTTIIPASTRRLKFPEKTKIHLRKKWSNCLEHVADEK